MSRSHDPAARGGVRAARPADEQEPRDWRFGGAPQRRDARPAAPVPASEAGGWPAPAARNPAPVPPSTSYAPQFDRYATAFETQRQAGHAAPQQAPEPPTAMSRGATGRAGYRSPYGGGEVPPPVPTLDPAPPARGAAPRPAATEAGWSRGSWRDARAAAPAQAAPQHWEPAPPEPVPAQQYAEEYAEGAEPQFGEPANGYYEPAPATAAYDPSAYAGGGHYGGEAAYRGEAAYDPNAYTADRYPDDPDLQPLPGDASFDGQPDAAASALEEEPPRRSRRGLMVIGALVAAIAVGGGLGAVYKMSVAPSPKSGKAAVVKADKKPVKSVPEDEEGLGLDGSKKSIYDRVGGTSAEDETAGAVVSGEEEPVARPETAESGLPEMPGIALAGPTPGSAGEEDVVATGPRKVATVVVKPGETITAADEAEVATADAETVTPEEAVAAVKSKAKKELAKAVEADVVPEVPVATTASKSKTKTKVVVATAEDATEAEPAPATTGKKKATKSILPEVPAEDDATASAPKAATPPASSGGANGYVVQVKATKTRMEALGAYADLQQRFGGLLGSSQPDIQEVDLGAKGKWFRLRIGPPASKSAAGDLCGKLKGSGLKECLVSAY